MQDILIDINTGDLATDISGNIVRGLSDDQHKDLLLICEKGEFKESPIATVGLMRFVESEDVSVLFTEIKKCFENDGCKIAEVSQDAATSKIFIDASYN